MSLANEQLLQYAQSREYVRNDLLPLALFINHSQPSAIFPYQNLRNHYYSEVQSHTIARTYPPVGQSLLAVHQGFGWAPSYTLSDEQARQLALSLSLQNPAPIIYRTAQQ